jgi:hypothetical protein
MIGPADLLHPTPAPNLKTYVLVTKTLFSNFICVAEA